MSDEAQQTFTARDIVLEFFPATPERLVPKPSQYRLTDENGSLLLKNKHHDILLKLAPLTPSGATNVQLCCDFCQHHAPRNYLRLYRAEVLQSQGRHFCYISLCCQHEACETRRLSDKPIEQLLQRVGYC